MLIFSQCVQMTVAAILTVLVGFHVVKVWHFLTGSFIVGFAQAFRGPGLLGAHPQPGTQRGHAQRHCPEFDPVQRGGRGGAGAGRTGAPFWAPPGVSGSTRFRSWLPWSRF
jgi:hypothetical protein